MKLSLIFCKFTPLVLVFSTLAILSSNKSISAPSISDISNFFRPPVRFNGRTQTPDPPPPPPRPELIHSYTKITLKNDTRRNLRIYTQFHINGRWQSRPEENSPALIPPGQAYSPVIIPDATKDKENVVTGKNFVIVVVADGKIWNPTSRFFQSLNNGAKYEYSNVIMNNGPEFTYPITEAKPPSQPWIFPIPTW